MSMTATTIRPCPWLDKDLSDREGEEWRSVVGYDGLYEVSNHGRIKSIARWVGVRGQSAMRFVRARILSQVLNAKTGARHCNLSQDGVIRGGQIMTRVAEAWLRPKGEGEVYYHINKDQQDNRLANLAVGMNSISVQVSYAVGAMSGLRSGQTIGQEQAARFARERAAIDKIDGSGALIARECKTCKAVKPIEDFPARDSSGIERRLVCWVCTSARDGVKNIGKQREASDLAAAGLRRCCRCKEVKRLDDDFGRASKEPTGRLHYCKGCRAAYKKRVVAA